MNYSNAVVIDTLKEIGNIGAGNAATALANMINRKIDMQVPKVNVLSCSEVPELLGGEENLTVCIFFKLVGDMGGSIIFVLPVESAKLLVNLMMPEMPFELGDEFSSSALKEIGNILSGSYIASLANLTNMSIHISTPSICIDMAGAILSTISIEYGMMGDTVLIIQNDFVDEVENSKIDGFFFLIPDEDSIGKLFSKFGIEI